MFRDVDISKKAHYPNVAGGWVNPWASSIYSQRNDLNLTIDVAVLTQTPRCADGDLDKIVASRCARQRQRLPVKSATNPAERVARGRKLGFEPLDEI